MTDLSTSGFFRPTARASLGVITLDEEGRVLTWKQAAEDIFGWKAEEAIGQLSPHIPPDQLQDLSDQLRSVHQGSPQTSLGQSRLRKDASPVEVDVCRVALPPDHVLELIEDRAGRERAEHTAAEENLFKAAILNSLPTHIAVIDAHGQIIAVNQSWNDFATQNGVQNLFQVGVGQNYLEVCRGVHGGEDYPYAHAALVGIQAVLDGKHDVFELEYPSHSPAEKRWFAMRVTPLGDAHGGAVITHENITRRHYAELARQSAEKRLSAILNIAADCIIAIDGARNILLFNRWAERVFGYSAAEMIGQPVSRLISEDFVNRRIAALDTQPRSDHPGEQIVAERLLISGIRKGGQEFPAEASIATVLLDNQPILVAVVRDITERRRAENQIRAYAERQKMLTEVSLQINKMQTIQEISTLVTEKAREIIGAHLAVTTQAGADDPAQSIRAISRSAKYATYTDLDLVPEDRGIYTLASPDRQFLLLTRDELLEAPIIRRDGSTLGLIQLADKYEGAFDESDEATLVQLTQVAAVAMENALLYDEVRQAERRYRSIFENSIEGLFQLTADSDLLSGNPALAHLLGYANVDELLRDQPEIRLGIFSNPEEYDRLLEKLNQDGAVQGYEVRIRTRDGNQRWVSMSINARSTNQDGTPIFEGSIRDISERKRRLRELEALAEISSTLRTASNRSEMAPIILGQLLHSISADGALFFFAEENGAAQVELAQGDWGALSGQRLEEGPLLSALQSVHQPQVLNPAENPLLAVEPFQRCASLVVAPVHVPGQFSGSLWLGLRTSAHQWTREFNEEDASLLGAIADVVSNAIMRSSLNEQIEQRLRTILALHSIDMAISSSIDARLTTRIILDQGTALLGVDAMDVLRYNRTTQYLEYTAGHGFQTRLIEQTRQRLGEGTSGHAALERRTIVLPQLADDPDFKHARLAQVEKFVFYAAVPLVAKGQLKGLLEVFSRSPLRATNEWRDLLETLATETAIALDNNQLFEDLQRSNVELTLAYDATIEGWARALELKDRETEGHSQRVTQMTMRLARRLGAPEEDLVHIQRGAQLHDIGKMGIPDNILLKPGPLTEEEWVLMRSHVQLGLKMLAGIPFLKRALDIPRAHHEKWDGSGYPNQLKGLQIPLAARVFAVIDVWDALSYDRPYRAAWPQEKVLAYIREQSGKHFDPEVATAFLDMLQEEHDLPVPA